MNLPPVSQVSPLNVNMFALELAHHPDQALVSEVLQGLSQGFCLGFNPGTKLRSSKKNKASAYQHPDIIDAYLSNEIRLGRIAGPFLLPPISNLHVNTFGVIPKKGNLINGVLSWTCHLLLGLVLMKESILRISHFSTYKLMTSSGWSGNLGKGLSWLSSMLSQPTATLRYTHVTGTFWA